ncbi:MAG: hypothetical protein ACOX25_11770 [Caldicoprobacterales bacterium]|jgi:hypothetical protein|nr:hypothetical protein [Clostridiales bacterium]
MKNMEILQCLERGEISADKAVILLAGNRKKEALSTRDAHAGRKARWIKIRVRDEEHKLRFYLPISLISFGFSIGKLVTGSKSAADHEGVQIAQNVFNSIDKGDMKRLIQAMKGSGKTDLVEVIDGQMLVNISLV